MFDERENMHNNITKALLTAMLIPIIITQAGCSSKTGAAAQGGTASGAASTEPYSKQSFYFDTVCAITVYDMEKDEIRIIQKEELASGWGKRDSCFQHKKWFVIQCCFRATDRNEYDQILSRSSLTPRTTPSAASCSSTGAWDRV